ncbi:MAG: NlpC/P60 family protein [Clostridia bacterium]|nr:NlpC/P60 family protein [Clostridia bacterium]
MRIGHAVMNENGGARGGVAGDSTGKEIRIQQWYDRTGGWQIYLEPKERALGDLAAEWMEKICGDARFGYDQADRWSGYKEIKKRGFDGAKPSDFDCSSLVISCYILAGVDLLPTGYTQNMARYLMNTGLFNEYTDEEHLRGTELLRRGGVLIAPGKHTCMVLDDGERIGADTETPVADKLTVKGGSVRVRTHPVEGKTVCILHKGAVRDIVTRDENTGWWCIREGWITDNEKLVEVVERA